MRLAFIAFASILATAVMAIPIENHNEKRVSVAAIPFVIVG